MFSGIPCIYEFLYNFDTVYILISETWGHQIGCNQLQGVSINMGISDELDVVFVKI